MILYFSLKTTSCFNQPRENSLQIQELDETYTGSLSGTLAKAV